MGKKKQSSSPSSHSAFSTSANSKSDSRVSAQAYEEAIDVVAAATKAINAPSSYISSGFQSENVVRVLNVAKTTTSKEDVSAYSNFKESKEDVNGLQDTRSATSLLTRNTARKVSSKAAINGPKASKADINEQPINREFARTNAFFEDDEEEDDTQEMDINFNCVQDSYELHRRRRMLEPITPLSNQLCARISRLVQGIPYDEADAGDDDVLVNNGSSSDKEKNFELQYFLAKDAAQAFLNVHDPSSVENISQSNPKEEDEAGADPHVARTQPVSLSGEVLRTHAYFDGYASGSSAQTVFSEVEGNVAHAHHDEGEHVDVTGFSNHASTLPEGQQAVVPKLVECVSVSHVCCPLLGPLADVGSPADASATKQQGGGQLSGQSQPAATLGQGSGLHVQPEEVEADKESHVAASHANTKASSQRQLWNSVSSKEQHDINQACFSKVVGPIDGCTCLDQNLGLKPCDLQDSSLAHAQQRTGGLPKVGNSFYPVELHADECVLIKDVGPKVRDFHGVKVGTPHHRSGPVHGQFQVVKGSVGVLGNVGHVNPLVATSDTCGKTNEPTAQEAHTDAAGYSSIVPITDNTKKLFSQLFVPKTGLQSDREFPPASLSCTREGLVNTVTISDFKLNHFDHEIMVNEANPLIPKVKAPKSLVEEGIAVWDNTLVGHFVGKKLPYSIVASAIHRLWDNKGLVDILSSESGVFYFKFSCSAACEAALEGGPWFIIGRPIVLQKWQPRQKVDTRSQSHIPIWVHLVGVPLEFWNPKGLSFVSSVLGKPLHVDRMTASCRRISYARVCVEVSADKDFIPEFDIEVDDEHSGKSVVHRIQVKYQWTPMRCSKCVSFGHDCSKIVKPRPPSMHKTEGRLWKVVPSIDKGKKKVEFSPTVASGRLDDCPSSSTIIPQMEEDSIITTFFPSQEILSKDPRVKREVSQVIPVKNSFQALPSEDDIGAAMEHVEAVQDTFTDNDCVEDADDINDELTRGYPASPPSSRQRKKNAKVNHSGNRPKGRHKH